MRKVELLPTRDCEAGYGPGLGVAVRVRCRELSGYPYIYQLAVATVVLGYYETYLAGQRYPGV